MLGRRALPLRLGVGALSLVAPAAIAAPPVAACPPLAPALQSRALELERGPLTARQEPRLDAPVAGRFGLRTSEGVSRVFLALERLDDAGCQALWYRVQLPQRPNGATGWIRADQVRPYLVSLRLRLDRSRRRLTVLRGGRVVRRLTVAVGRQSTPTPLGSFYVYERLYLSDPRGAYGPGALGISAFSNVLTGWAQGGPVAIHGTSHPETIGTDASNGCVRVRNEQMRWLLRVVVPGTPIDVLP